MSWLPINKKCNSDNSDFFSKKDALVGTHFEILALNLICITRDGVACFLHQVSQLLAALQAGSRGTQACINAASTVSGIIGDLDPTIMFATAGTLNAEGEESFADHR